MCVGGLTGQRSKADVCVCVCEGGGCMSLPHPILLFVLSASQVQFPSVCVCGGGGGGGACNYLIPSFYLSCQHLKFSFFLLSNFMATCLLTSNTSFTSVK